SGPSKWSFHSKFNSESTGFTRGGTMKLLEGQTVGIDLGTTFSAIAQLDVEGRPISTPNADGRTVTPSVVLLGDSGHVIVGPSVERISIEPPEHIVEAIKRQMGNKEY